MCSDKWAVTRHLHLCERAAGQRVQEVNCRSDRIEYRSDGVNRLRGIPREREQEMALRVGRKTPLNNSLISEEAGAAVHVFLIKKHGHILVPAYQIIIATFIFVISATINETQQG